MPRQREVKPWTIYPPTQEDREIIEQKAAEASLSVSAYLCMVGKLANIAVSLPTGQRVLSETQVIPTLKENPKKDDIGAIFEAIEAEKEAEDAANPTDLKPFARNLDCELDEPEIVADKETVVEYKAYCKDGFGTGGYCDDCSHHEYDEEGRSFCVKYGDIPLAGDIKSEIIHAVKDGKAKLLEAYINATDDFVVERIYNDEQYTVVSNVMDEDIPLTYKEIYTEALRPTLIEDYSVFVQSDGTVTITLWGSCIERGKTFNEEFRELHLTEEDAEHIEFSLELVELDGFMDILGLGAEWLPAGQPLSEQQIVTIAEPELTQKKPYILCDMSGNPLSQADSKFVHQERAAGRTSKIILTEDEDPYHTRQVWYCTANNLKFEVIKEV